MIEELQPTDAKPEASEDPPSQSVIAVKDDIDRPRKESQCFEGDDNKDISMETYDTLVLPPLKEDQGKWYWVALRGNTLRHVSSSCAFAIQIATKRMQLRFFRPLATAAAKALQDGGDS